MEVLMAIDSVLNDERKSSTYKYALLASIIDYVIENPTELTINNFHRIPLIYIAKRWLYYYYPLMLYGENGVKQGHPQIALAKKIREFARNEKDLKIAYNESIAIIKIRDLIETGGVISSNLLKLLIKIRYRIIEQPLQYIKIGGIIGGEKKTIGNVEVKQTSFSLFGLSSTSFKESSNYDDRRKKCLKWRGDTSEKTWADVIASETCHLIMGHYTYYELVKLRYYIKDAIIKKWIEFSVERYLSNDGNATYALIKGISLCEATMDRDNSVMKQLRQIVKDNFGTIYCIYCDHEINKFELDHFIPWSKYPTNYFWNLYPACERCNNSKKANLIKINSNIELRLRSTMRKWLDYFDVRSDEKIKFGGMKDVTAIDDQIDYHIEQIKEICEYLI